MNKNLLAYLSLIIVCLVWGSTYFAIRIGVATFPPFLFSAIRQIMAGGIMLVALKIIGKLQLRRSDLLNQSITGILMVTLGNGVIGWCERYITSGLAALILSLIPVFVVVISYLFRRCFTIHIKIPNCISLRFRIIPIHIFRCGYLPKGGSTTFKRVVVSHQLVNTHAVVVSYLLGIKA